jgi:twitching motility protein PilT
LVTGPSGSGKTTALAAFIHHTQAAGRKKIITIEDPIEVKYPESGGEVIQLEVGNHVASFADGLKSALRQQPHIILVGEIRTAEAMMMCMDASKTNHMILGTLHSRGAVAVMRRISQFFPLEQSAMIYQIAAESLQFVLSLGLLPSSVEGTAPVLAFDFFTAPDHRARANLSNAHERPQGILEEMSRTHNITWRQSLQSLRHSNRITDDTYREAMRVLASGSERTSPSDGPMG